MSSTLHLNLTEAESLVQRKDFTNLLTVLQRIAIEEIETDVDRSRFHHMYAWYYYGTGRFPQALQRIESALALSKRTANYSLFASQKQLLGRTHKALGEITGAIEAFTEALVFMRNAEEHPKLYGALVDLASSHLLRGDLPVALHVLNDALEYAQKYNGAEEVRVCQTNRSIILIILGEFKEADLILKSYYNDPNVKVPDRAFVCLALGMLNVFKLNEDEAFRYLTEALHLYKELDMQREQIICLEYLGENKYFAGNYREAKRHYVVDILSREEITASARAQTLRMLTDVYIAEGDFDNATETAKESEEAITKINEQKELGALYRAWGQIHGHKRDQNKARESFRKSISLLHRLNARYEEALTYLTCGRSDAYNTDERLHYLTIAKELFAEMDIGNWVKQIESELATLAAEQNAREQAATEAVSRKIEQLEKKLVALKGEGASESLGAAISKTKLSVFGWLLLAFSALICLGGILVFGESLTGLALFFVSGFLAVQAIVLMVAVKHKEKKKAFP